MAVLKHTHHPLHRRLVRSFQRPAADTVQILSTCYSGFILDQLGKAGSMLPQLKPLRPGMRLCGPATTVLGADLSVRRMAINLAEPGDILVVAAGGTTDYACFGDGTARKMLLKGLTGAVIDGATRDAAGLAALPFATFVRGVTPRNYDYPVDANFGAVNVPVTCAGLTVHPGDVIFGDDDGVLVIPRATAEALAAFIGEEVAAERAARAAMTSFVPFDVEQELLDRGYRFE